MNQSEATQTVPRRWAVYVLQDALGGKAHQGYLVAYDLEAMNGVGDIMCSENIMDAMLFDSPQHVIEAYNGVPKCHPVRVTDGQPNQPLRAFTVQILEVPATIVEQRLTQQKRGH